MGNASLEMSHGHRAWPSLWMCLPWAYRVCRGWDKVWSVILLPLEAGHKDTPVNCMPHLAACDSPDLTGAKRRPWGFHSALMSHQFKASFPQLLSLPYCPSLCARGQCYHWASAEPFSKRGDIMLAFMSHWFSNFYLLFFFNVVWLRPLFLHATPSNFQWLSPLPCRSVGVFPWAVKGKTGNRMRSTTEQSSTWWPLSPWSPTPWSPTT